MLRSSLVWLALAAPLSATDYVVAPSGGDFTSIQAALDVAGAGDRVLVQDKPGGWNERLVLSHGGAPGAPLELLAAPGHAPALDGTGVPGIWMITIEDVDHVHVRGLEIRDNLGVPNDGSGIRVQGACAGVELRDCTIHDMRGFGAMGITVYGSSPTTPITGLVIDGCLVYDCEPADSEAITLNGNVTDFAVTNNVVRDVNNIGIDFIGGEFGPGPEFQARNGVCRGNVVLRANSSYGGGYAAGIYVDGARDVLIERNYVSGCDLGIEVGAENAGVDATGVVVHSNVVIANEKVGLIFGGYDATVGRVRQCVFANNVVVGNDTLALGNGEVWVQWAEDCDVVHNVVWPGAGALAVSNEATTSGIRFRRNVYHAGVPEAQVRRRWLDVEHLGLAAWTAATGLDADSSFADPAFADLDGPDDVLGTPDDLPRPLAGSPLVDAGDPALVHPLQTADHVGAPRVLGPAVDVGAYEVAFAASTPRNGTGSNPLAFAEVSPAVLGGAWSGTVDLSASPAGTWSAVVVTSQPLAGLPTPFGELLVAEATFGAVTYLVSVLPPSGSTATHAAAIPADPGLLGLAVHAQAVLLESPPRLTNALDLTLGYTP